MALVKAGVTLCVVMVTSATAGQAGAAGLRVGWATTNITPDKPVLMPGFHGKRISGGVRDPLTATVLALESIGPGGDVAEQAIMVSCDLIAINRSTQDSVKEIIKDRLPGFDSDKLFLNATHTHQGALAQSGVFKGVFRLTPAERARGVMTGDEYGKFLVGRVAEAVVKAWKERRPGGLSWALDQAVVGFNRRYVYFDGSARMLGPVNTAEFDCVEGVEDHGLSLLFFWDTDKKLTGIVINVASTAQAEQGGSRISADFWHDVRKEIAARHSKDVFVFPQCGAAGDIYNSGKFRHRAEAAMAARKGISWRQEIGRRIADGVGRALPVARTGVDFKPVFKHTVARVDLPVEDPPAPPFYITDPVKPAEFHVVRLGDVAVVTNPFELFVDYGIRMQARSKAVLTFVVQLSCHASGYLPTARAVRGGGYSAVEYLVGPDGGRVLVDESVKRINALWP
ncbi:MAG: hypothetical protein ISS72_05405 [Candidatus Brocadiae bacterium]|nr:hypothetical protein [Candidatus Brocadiia bacterium]